MAREYFTQGEATEKIGQIIETRVEFSGVPSGTRGRVVGSYPANRVDYGIEIQWDRFPGDHLIDGFSKSEYDQFLTEVQYGG